MIELCLDPAVVTKSNKGEKKAGGGDIPEHGIRPGDIVAVQEQPAGSAKKAEKRELKSSGVEGVVLRVRRENVEVILDKEDVDVPGGRGRLWLLVSSGLMTLGLKGRR